MMKFSNRLTNGLLTVTLSSFFYISVVGQVYINEFLASNASVIADPDYQKYADWIEIYNAGNDAVNLSGYYLTDNLNNPDKWQITTNLIVGAHGFLLIWADGNDFQDHTSFKLAMEGEEIGLFSSDLVPIDTLRFIYQTTDVSYGRNPDGEQNWAYYTVPTPGSPNTTTAYTDRVENVPEFSVFGGIFDSPVEVELKTILGGTIRYTTDGTEPSASSPVYSGPILMNVTTILRARILKSGMIPGRVVTHSYFIDETLKERGLPIISIATDPDNFWDPESGIYVQDFKPDWEVPINIELFRNDGSDRAAFNELAGTKINGLYSWQLPQKMLGIYFRKQYGNSYLDYPLIPDVKRTRYKSFALRASGSDWSYTLFRDGMIQSSTRPNMNVGIMGFQPCIVFVNGEYMGIHNIREKVDDSYIEENYSMPEGFFDLIENEDFPEAGDLTEYNELLDLISEDLSVQSNFNAVTKKIDIEEFTDYVITEIYSQNTSLTHNVMAWKPKNTGKWKWILMDLDRGFFIPENNLISSYVNQDVIPLRELLENQEYKEYFAKRFADHLYTTFNPVSIRKLIDRHQQWIEDEMPYHIERWLGTTSSYGDAMPSMEYWYDQVSVLHDFADVRPQVLLNDLRNYGLSNTVTLNLSVFPAKGGSLVFNDFVIPETTWTGPYPQNLQIQLNAIDKPGYDFQGWAQSTQQVIIPEGSVWKYLDNGSDQGLAWKEEGFNDAGWASGQAELGYGDGDEQTVISYGGDANHKYITSYFRKSFTLTADEMNASQFTINLLRDDGAVVYINGQEVIRSNMGSGPINFESRATNPVSGSEESEFYSFNIDGSAFKEGENCIAVEVHQNSASSSDLSFNLELVFYLPNTSSFVSTNPNYTFTLLQDRSLTAVYSRNEQCILPEVIDADLTLDKDCSPYVSQGDITIAPEATLTIDSGVQIYMAENSNIFIHGRIEAHGSETEPVFFRLNPDYKEEKWGALCFHNTEEPSHLSYVTISNASNGPDPVYDIAAISAFYADLVLDHITILKVFQNPITARYSDIILTNSKLHSIVPGDLINVKYGSARIENTDFYGNDQPDTDGIDYDDISDGTIRNCTIHDFYGFNSDGVDIGEHARNILIDSLLIYNIIDKGISVGQFSTVNVSNCIIANCSLGLGLKDSCRVTIDQCTFYGTGIPVSCFEKNPGSAGGNAIVNNSILSNSYDHSIYSDSRSILQLGYCIADNDTLSEFHHNIYGNPFFRDPSFFDFQLQPNSPCILAGNENGAIIDMGSQFHSSGAESQLMFSLIFYNPLNDPHRSEFICLKNPSEVTVDLLGYRIDQGIEYTFSDNTLLEPGNRLFLVKDIHNPEPESYLGQVLEWTRGSLANEGEKLRLIHPSGIVIDQLVYSPDSPWPDITSESKDVLSLIDAGMDNHFGTSWTVVSYTSALPTIEIQSELSIHVYPNPTRGMIYIASGEANSQVSVYTLTGELIVTCKLDALGQAQIDLSDYGNGILLLKTGNTTKKIILIN